MLPVSCMRKQVCVIELTKNVSFNDEDLRVLGLT